MFDDLRHFNELATAYHWCQRRNDEIAGEIADMIIRDGVLRAEKLANVYGLDDDDAENILSWIMYMPILALTSNLYPKRIHQ